MQTYTLSDFNFHLPDNLIAQEALTERSSSRLMIVTSFPNNKSISTDTLNQKKQSDCLSARLNDTTFANLPNYLKSGDLLICNNTEVLKARLYGRKKTGGQVEILIERVIEEYVAISQIRASKSLKLGSIIYISDEITLCVEECLGKFYKICFSKPCLKTLDQYGQTPLPPYIHRTANIYDEKRYQTTYASIPGAIAAPTAGLHFDHALLSTIRAQGVQIHSLTLHVGSGTFSPIRCECIHQHKMHSELYKIPKETINAIKNTKKQGGAIISIGTTTLRALESAALKNQFDDRDIQIDSNTWHETDLFVTPGFKFQIVDKLVTNFHLPKSSLLILVSAFAGYKTIKEAYLHAIKKRYRFFSYGDAMLVSCSAKKN